MDISSIIRGIFGINQFHCDRADKFAEGYYISEPSENDHENPRYPFVPYNEENLSSPVDFFFSHVDMMYRNVSSFLDHSCSEEDMGFLSAGIPVLDSNPRDQMLKSPESKFPKSFWLHDEDGKLEPQRDTDLDEKALQDKTKFLDDNLYLEGSPRSSFIQKSVFISKVRQPDGSIEEHHSVRDQSGTEATTVRKTIGDQSYEVTVHTDSKGLKQKKENFVNLDEKDLAAFEKKWYQRDQSFLTPPLNPAGQPSQFFKNPPGDLSYSSIFQKLFGF